MKTMWEKPFTHVEQFAADNYCAAACFTLACAVEKDGEFPDMVNYTESQLWGTYTSENKYSAANPDGWIIKNGDGEHDGTCKYSQYNYVSIKEDGTYSVIEDTTTQQYSQGKLTAPFCKGFDLEGTEDGLGANDLFTWVTIGIATQDGGYADSRRVWRHWAIAGEAVEGRPLMHS